MNKRRRSLFLLGGMVAAILMGIHLTESDEPCKGTPRTYEEIMQSGVIRATTEYNSIGYHVKDDTIAGFHYELLQAFADAKHLKADIVPEMELGVQIAGVDHGTYDVIAGSLLITSEQKDSVLLFTQPIVRNRQILIQRKPKSETDSLYIRSQLELGGKTVFIPKDSPAQFRIHNLGMEIADTIHIKEFPQYGSEQLLALVAHGDIDYAICEESIARKLIDRYPQLDINTAVSFNQFYGWGTSKESQELTDTINAWLDRYMQTKAFDNLLKKYFK